MPAPISRAPSCRPRHEDYLPFRQICERRTGRPDTTELWEEWATMRPEGSELVMARGQMRYPLAGARFEFFIVEIQMR